MKKLILVAILTAALVGVAEARGVQICSRSGVCARVNPEAASALQCVIRHVEGAGVRIKSMRGYGHGTVRRSRHPAGMALDINQTARGRTRPHVPGRVSDAAGSACGVVSGNRWRSNDNGHWNL